MRKWIIMYRRADQLLIRTKNRGISFRSNQFFFAVKCNRLKTIILRSPVTKFQFDPRVFSILASFIFVCIMNGIRNNNISFLNCISTLKCNVVIMFARLLHSISFIYQFIKFIETSSASIYHSLNYRMFVTSQAGNCLI